MLHAQAQPRCQRQPQHAGASSPRCRRRLHVQPGPRQRCSQSLNPKRLAVKASAAAGGSSGGNEPGVQQQPSAASDRSPVPATARVALRTGIYISVLGLVVFVWPSSFGLLFDASLVTPGWVRVGGVLASLFGGYYIGAARDDAEGREPTHFYAATIAGRLALSAAFAALVAARQCEPALLWLAAANAASSLLLWRACRQRHASVAMQAGSVT